MDFHLKWIGFTKGFGLRLIEFALGFQELSKRFQFMFVEFRWVLNGLSIAFYELSMDFQQYMLARNFGLVSVDHHLIFNRSACLE